MSKIRVDRLLISSDFYSVQGEGISTGIPSYFVRLGLCNLTCGMSNKFLNQLVKDKTIGDGDLFIGDLEQQGVASWTCDSTPQWSFRGIDQDFQYLIDRWIDEGIYEDILNGVVHIIWTGGEPCIKGHQIAIANFFDYWCKWEQARLTGDETYDKLQTFQFNEIETNGTVYIDQDLFDWINQINCSPKLANSGMSIKQRIVPKAIERIMEHHNYQFKFVISTEDDVQELFRDFVVPFNIPLKNIVCMPALVDESEFAERTRFCLEMAKKYKFRGMTRLHIAAWNKTLNV